MDTISHMLARDQARLLARVRRSGLISAREASRAGVHSQHLSRLVADGVLARIARGQYRLAGHPITERHGLVVAARAVPH